MSASRRLGYVEFASTQPRELKPRRIFSTTASTFDSMRAGMRFTRRIQARRAKFRDAVYDCRRSDDEGYQSEIYPAHAFGNKVWFTLDGRMTETRVVSSAPDRLWLRILFIPGRSPGSPGTAAPVGRRASNYASSVCVRGSGTAYFRHPATDVNLFLHGDKYFAVSSRMTLPKITIGAYFGQQPWQVRFLGQRRLKAYVVMQAETSAGFLNDYAVYTLSPEFTPGCAVSLGAGSRNGNRTCRTGRRRA